MLLSHASLLSGGAARAAGAAETAPKSGCQQRKQAIQRKETEVSPRLTNFVLPMYHQLASQQRSQIFALLQRKTPRKEIALIVGRRQSTLCREIKRNSTDKGNYLWDKAHAKALERRKRSTSNKGLDSVLVWRIKLMIIDHQWPPEQICGVLAKENVSVSIQTVYNIINADESGEPRRHRHPDFKRRRGGGHRPPKGNQHSQPHKHT